MTDHEPTGESADSVEQKYTGAEVARQLSAIPGESEAARNRSEIRRDEADWETTIILQRHSAYDNRFPADWASPTAEEAETLGKLTPEGQEQARMAAEARVSELLAQGKGKVDFLVIASPTYWVDRPEFGQRAIETGKIIAAEILRQLQEADLPEDQLLNLTASFQGDTVRESRRIVESQMFQFPDFANELRSKYGGQKREFWDAYNDDADRERRLEVGAEGSPEAAERVNLLMKTVARLGREHHRQHPDRRLAVFVVSHHEAIEPYALRVLGTEPGEFEPQYNDGITIKIGSDNESLGHAQIKDRDIEVNFGRQPKPKSSEAG